jgi:hypothetical protein
MEAYVTTHTHFDDKGEFRAYLASLDPGYAFSAGSATRCPLRGFAKATGEMTCPVVSDELLYYIDLRSDKNRSDPLTDWQKAFVAAVDQAATDRRHAGIIHPFVTTAEMALATFDQLFKED